MLPSQLFLITFSYYFYKAKKNPTGKQLIMLEDYFWKASLSEVYSHQTQHRLNADLERINLIVNNELPEYDYDIDFDINRLIEKGYFKTSFTAFSKAVVCAYLINQPLSLSNGGLINVDKCLSKINKSNYHHFFPISYINKRNKKENPNNVFNMIIVDAYSNQIEIKDKAPSEYIQNYTDNNRFKDIMKSHYIGDIKEFGITTNNYKKFLKKRAEMLINEIKNRTTINKG